MGGRWFASESHAGPPLAGTRAISEAKRPSPLAEASRGALQTTAGGLIMSTSGTKQMHDATIGTVLAVGSEVKVCALPHGGSPLLLVAPPDGHEPARHCITPRLNVQRPEAIVP